MQNYYFLLSGSVFEELRRAPVFQQGLVIAVLSLISVFAVLFTFYLAVRFLGNVKKPAKLAPASAIASPEAPVQAVETPEVPLTAHEEVSADKHKLMGTTMLRKFRIKVNDIVYEVASEELSSAGGSLAAPAPATATAPATTPASAAAPAPTAAPAPKAAPAPSAGGGTPVYAPMPGTVLAINKAVGDTVATNEAVLILEAMKMENEIVAPKAGKIASIQVSNGQQVEASSVLFTIV